MAGTAVVLGTGAVGADEVAVPVAWVAAATFSAA